MNSPDFFKKKKENCIFKAPPVTCFRKTHLQAKLRFFDILKISNFMAKQALLVC